MSRISGWHVARRAPILVYGTNPAAGSEASATVPAGHRWRVLSISGTLVTDGNAANRRARLTVSDGDSVYMTLPGPVDQPASTTLGYVWAPVGAAENDAANYLIPMPDLWLLPGAIIATSTGNKQVGDDWSQLVVSVVDELVRQGPADLDDLMSQFLDATAAANA